MVSSRKRIVKCVSAGEPPKEILTDVETVKFIIYNFKERKEKRDEEIESPIVEAHGYEWTFSIYPRGRDMSSSERAHVSCYLTFIGLRKQDDITAKSTFRCKGFEWKMKPKTFSPKTSKGKFNFLEREHVLENFLEEDGSLVIECDIQIAAEDKRVWYPKELEQQDILVQLYQNASSETSDVLFSVGETKYRTHKSILSLRVKKLYEIAKECHSETPIPIHSCRGEIFKSVLDFVYTVKTPDIENEGTATELLVAADRYDCLQLKLYVESVIVDKFLRAENAAAMLLFADSHSCALLKEAAKNLFVTDTETVKNADAWSDIKESNRLLVELLDSFAMCSKKHKHLAEDCTSEIDRLDVTALRKELEEIDLELDGSRDVLVNRLKTHRESGVPET